MKVLAEIKALESKIADSSLNEFVEYVWSFYGPHQVHGDFFDHNLTKKEVITAAKKRMKSEAWGGGDTFDREFVRDMMLKARGAPASSLEYKASVKNAAAPPEELSAHDVAILKKFYTKFKEMRNSLNHVFDLGTDEIHRLRNSEETEQWLIDDVAKALEANRKTIDILAKLDTDFISIFKKRPEIFG